MSTTAPTTPASTGTPNRLVGYTGLSILLHWIGAALIVTLFVIGERFEDMPRGPDKAALIGLHISIGLIAFVVIGWRILHRLFGSDGAPARVPAGALDHIANIVKYALILAMAVLIITGPLSFLVAGRPLGFFGLFQIPSPFTANRDLGEALEGIHGGAVKVLVPLVILHVLGAVKHLVIDRDGVFSRILVPARRP